MIKIKALLFVVFTALLLSSLAGCSSKGYSGSTSIYYSNDPWAYDRYYRSRVHHHHNRPNRPDKPNRPPNRPSKPNRPTQLPVRR